MSLFHDCFLILIFIVVVVFFAIVLVLVVFVLFGFVEDRAGAAEPVPALLRQATQVKNIWAPYGA